MNTYRKNGIIAGALLLVGFIGVLIPNYKDPGYLVKISKNVNSAISGGLFQMIMAFACAGIAIFLYPVLKKYDEAFALASVGSRIIEAILFLVGAVATLSLVLLSQEFGKAGMPDNSYFQTVGALLRGINKTTGNFGLFAWCIGAFFYHYIFYRTKLIPRWLAFWGLIGVPFSLTANILLLFGFTDSMSLVDTVLQLPLGLQEIPFALWLIVKGFNQEALNLLDVKSIVK